jgi:hypothetical protein
VAQITASDVVRCGVRNHLIVFGTKAVVFCNMNPSDAVQAYTPHAAVFEAEDIVEKIETKAGWTFPQPNSDSSPSYTGWHDVAWW